MWVPLRQPAATSKLTRDLCLYSVSMRMTTTRESVKTVGSKSRQSFSAARDTILYMERGILIEWRLMIAYSESSTNSLLSYVTDFRSENGRTYHTYQDGRKCNIRSIRRYRLMLVFA